MANLTNGTNYTGDITLTKQTGTVLTLSTAEKYVDRAIQFGLEVQSGASAADVAEANAYVESTDDAGSGGVNISGVIGNKTTTEPSSGYFIRVRATASGNSRITTAGWMDAGSLASASDEETMFFPVNAASLGVSGTNTVTPTASIAGSNVTLSNTDNGISMTATGGGTARAAVTGSASAAGYAPAGEFDSENIDAASQTTQAQTYISGVNLTAPTTGTRSFAITVPNGSSTVTFTFTVDSDGNVTIG